MYCKLQGRVERVDLEEFKNWLVNQLEINTTYSIVGIDNGETSTYCVLDSELGTGRAVGAVLNSGLTGCHGASVLTEDEKGHFQCEVVSSTFNNDDEREPSPDEKLSQQESQQEKSSHSNVFCLCDHCNTTFLSLDAYNEHNVQCRKSRKRKSPEPGKKKRHTCDQCKKSFTTQSNMKAHQRRAHKGRRYSCTEPGCKKQFTQLAHLERHIKNIHWGIKHTCDKCNKSFTTEDYLKNHQKNVIHQPSEQIKYACPERGCNDLFTTTASMRRHQQRAHNICILPGCFQSFRTASELKRHRDSVHQGM